MAKALILVVDDSPTIRTIVTKALSRGDYDVITAENGVRALASIKDNRPDLIFLDIMLPGLNGYQLCSIIKRNKDFKDIPVVMLSGKDGFFDKFRGKWVGASGYITKPSSFEDSKKFPQLLLDNTVKYLRR